jgi:hypothetical protein
MCYSITHQTDLRQVILVKVNVGLCLFGFICSYYLTHSRQVLKDHPELEYFHNLWLIQALIKQYLKNSSNKVREMDKCHAAHIGRPPLLVKNQNKKMKGKLTDGLQDKSHRNAGRKLKEKNFATCKKNSGIKHQQSSASDKDSKSRTAVDVRGMKRKDKGKGKEKATQRSTTTVVMVSLILDLFLYLYNTLRLRLLHQN